MLQNVDLLGVMCKQLVNISASKVQTTCSLDNKTKAPAAMGGDRVSNNFCRQSFIPKDPVQHGNE
jgi:hypothetical protein